ncbi:hypothetical protein SAMN05216387_102230 [Nitrosovibrio tenuis]|uniref:Uncharacterized protein n=1 Tax=Nitrosovibrio tenuis TaxID=1233 RepID=A0A1H7IP10_9PROT|nr:hypothetical protein SAMN05216387_102230 [Nitrosovibrio tenuis]
MRVNGQEQTNCPRDSICPALGLGMRLEFFIKEQAGVWAGYGSHLPILFYLSYPFLRDHYLGLDRLHRTS